MVKYCTHASQSPEPMLKNKYCTWTSNPTQRRWRQAGGRLFLRLFSDLHRYVWHSHACTHVHTHVCARVHTHTLQKVKGKAGRRGKKEKMTLAKRKCHLFHPVGTWVDRREGGNDRGWRDGE